MDYFRVPASIRDIARAIEAFKEKFGHEPKVYDVVISDGARKLE